MASKKARDERYERRAEMNYERFLMEEKERRKEKTIEQRERRRDNRGRVREFMQAQEAEARVSEFMQRQEAEAREAEDAAREKAEQEAEDERIFAAKKTADVRASLQASIDNAISKRDSEMSLAREINDAASRKHRHIERETFTLEEENCNGDIRKVVVLPLPKSKKWYAPNIAFFKSTASSNGASFIHLRDTYLPTLGVLDASGKYNPDDERVAGLEPLEGYGDIIIKTGLFKSIFACKPPPSARLSAMAQPPIPIWINEVLTEYCSLYYPTLIVRDFYRPIVDKADYDETEQLFDSLQEMYQLFDLCMYYFSDVWQIAMSIGLSEFTGKGVWVEDGNVKASGDPARKFIQFASFIKTKFDYTVTGYKGEFGEKPLRAFLQEQDAQSDFRFEPLPGIVTSQSNYVLFTGKSVQALGVPLRTFKSLNPLQFKKGGTRRRKLVKTRRQKRR